MMSAFNIGRIAGFGLACAASMALMAGCAEEETAASDGAESSEGAAPGRVTIGPDTDDPWTGSLQDGIEAMSSGVASGEFGDALLIANRMVRPDAFARFRSRLETWTRGASESALAPITRLLDAAGVDALTSEDRAEIEFARGLVLTEVQAAGPEVMETLAIERPIVAAVSAFERARAAGGAARSDSVFALGTIDLIAAEALRMTIPEIAQAAGGPPPPPTADDGEADPLVDARKLYRTARAHLVERLRLDAPLGLEDARANVELVVRRLRELDQIEEQREQQKDENEDKKDGEDEQEKDENKENEDKKDDGDKKENEDKSDEESEGDPEQEEGEDPPPDDPEQEKDGEGEEEEEPEAPEDTSKEETPEEQSEEEKEGEEGEDSKEEPKPTEIAEERMTTEELQRFFERKQQYEEEGERRRKALRIKRKIPTQRDW